jgi:hypothetical protein
MTQHPTQKDRDYLISRRLLQVEIGILIVPLFGTPIKVA